MAKTKKYSQSPEKILTSEEMEVLRKFHEDKRNRIVKEHENALKKALKEIDSKLSVYKKGTGNKSAKHDKQENQIETIDKAQIKLALKTYDKNLPLTKKSLLITDEIGRVSTIREIFEKMAEYEPELKKDTKTSNTKAAHISSAIATMAEKKVSFFRYKDEDGTYKAGLLKWLDENGNVKDEYK